MSSRRVAYSEDLIRDNRPPVFLDHECPSELMGWLIQETPHYRRRRYFKFVDEQLSKHKDEVCKIYTLGHLTSLPFSDYKWILCFGNNTLVTEMENNTILIRTPYKSFNLICDSKLDTFLWFRVLSGVANAKSKTSELSHVVSSDESKSRMKLKKKITHGVKSKSALQTAVSHLE